MRLPLLVALAALALAGCGKAPEVPPVPPVPPSLGSRELRVFCRPESLPQTVIARFTKETGIAVFVENYAAKEEMLAGLLHGDPYDLVEADEDAAGALAKDGLLHPIDRARIPNFKNIAPTFLNRSFDPGNKFSVPFFASPVGIVFNAEQIPEGIRGFADVFVEKNRRAIVVLDDAREIVTLGFLAQGIPINEATDENLKKAEALLACWLPLAKVSGSPEAALAAGDAALGVVRGSEAAALLDKDKKFRWVIPAEGAHLAIASLVIPKSADNVTNAEAFIGFLLRPEIGKEASDARPSTNPNLAARKLLTPGQRANPASFPTDQEMARMQTFEDVGEQASKFDTVLTAIKGR
ncbi:MAG: spermidine/putrescine ABC transporter substrate-binding protein [Verrucomicrobiae bacterium]